MTLLKSRPAKSPKKKPASKQPAISPPEQSVVFSSEFGWILLGWQQSEVTLVSFGNTSPAEAARRGSAEPIDADEAPAWIKKLITRLQRYSQGKNVDLSDVPLHYASQTAFQKKVQEACRKIPRGHVCSYGELAAAVGSPGAARAVGSVMRTNRFPLIIPCHRVVASGGNLGGFSCPNGIEVKQKLLAFEGVVLGKSR
ncbi:methylated-DNA--[protein]-cysteine S-methyltransferase [Anatilimnocola sp. NA78]|uniref:methylated-DNA--[protein]-cysteine S-methyltransferase n=1 Tax=Anatilimnocola sp. NA78 TaxID=3415683 RepID=UPI003CE57F7C